RYGNKAKDGAIILTEALIVDDIKEVLKHMDLQKGNIKSSFIEVRKDSAPVLMSADIKYSETTPNPHLKLSADDLQPEFDDILAVQNDGAQIYTRQENKPLIFIDGVEQKDFTSSDVDPSKIKSINVLKDHNAIKKYGD
ncbi:TonB-dependent receptor plug domain-containing protein, partial [Tamlana crocina]